MNYCSKLLLLLLSVVGGEALAASSTEAIAAIAASPTPSASENLPASVDLRPQMKLWGLEPRNQGRRNTCSVFATTGAFEFAYSKHLDHGTRLSAEYLNWACNQIIHNTTQDRGQFFHDLLRGFDHYGICTDDEMPYVWKFDPELKPSDAALATAKKIRAVDFQVHWIRPFRRGLDLSDDQMHEMKRVLASGYPVAAGASHSRLLVGYTDDNNQPGGGTFMVRDSAGGKYRTVTYEFVKTNVNDVFWVEAPPKT